MFSGSFRSLKLATKSWMDCREARSSFMNSTGMHTHRSAHVSTIVKAQILSTLLNDLTPHEKINKKSEPISSDYRGFNVSACVQRAAAAVLRPTYIYTHSHAVMQHNRTPRHNLHNYRLHLGQYGESSVIKTRRKFPEGQNKF